MRAGDRILHIFSSNGEHDWHEGEVVAAPTTAAEKKRGFLYNVRYGANEMRAQGLRPEDYRKYWLRIAPHELGRQIGAMDQVDWPGATRRSGRKPSTTSTRLWRTMARG